MTAHVFYDLIHQSIIDKVAYNIVAYSARKFIYMLYFVSWRNSLVIEFNVKDETDIGFN
jgi:hypothetical protein